VGVRDVSSDALVLVVAVAVVVVSAMLVLVAVVTTIALESGKPIGKNPWYNCHTNNRHSSLTIIIIIMEPTQELGI
jgi:hypothetical protein